jgi:hypothetical protein
MPTIRRQFMKSFYEMLIILENEGDNAANAPMPRPTPVVPKSSYQDEEKEAYEKIEQALAKAGLKWDEDEFRVLYGKWMDVTLYVHPNGSKRVQGVIVPENIEKDDETISGLYPVGFEINNKSFDPTQIIEIHSIRVQMTYDDIIDDWRNEQDIERTQRMEPR